MSKYKISLVRLAAHDLNNALRVWARLVPATEIFSLILKERERAFSLFIKTFAFTVVLTLWLLANRPNLQLTIALIELDIPKAYINFALSSLAVGMFIQLMNYYVLNDFARLAVNRLFKFDNAPAFTVPIDGSASWSLGLYVQYRFFRSSRAHILVGLSATLFVLLPLFLVVATVYVTIFLTVLHAIGTEGFASVDGSVSAVSGLFAMFPIVYLAVVFTPFRFEKNSGFIRWIFLSRLYRRMGLKPPRVNNWLEKS